MGFANTAPNSGGTINNIQNEVNSIDSFIGKVSNIAPTALPPWNHNDVGTSTDPLFERLDAITLRFSGTTGIGHQHSGADGDGAPISLAGFSNSNNPPLPSDVSSIATLGATGNFAWGSHVHRGIRSIAVSGSSAAFGDITFVAGSGIGITPSSGGNIITFSASGGSSFTPTIPNIQTFTVGSGTYTTPTSPSPLYLRVRMVGAGGGGQGANTGGQGNNGSNGGNTTFGSSLLTANGGTGGNGTAVSGGSATINSPATKIAAITGGGGQAQIGATSGSFPCGGDGGNTWFGGGGAGGANGSAGQAASTSSGGGGGGAGGDNTNTGGGGGGAGGYVEAMIATPSATYAYVVGALGGGGSGTSANGGNGADGYLIVEAHFQ